MEATATHIAPLVQAPDAPGRAIRRLRWAWWPLVCLVVDWVVAAIIAVEILAGVQFHH
jgi:hypothetical protein